MECFGTGTTEVNLKHVGTTAVRASGLSCLSPGQYSMDVCGGECEGLVVCRLDLLVI